MNNIVGPDGMINHTGLPGAPSEIVDPKSASFWDNIEEGIKTTVDAVLLSGFLTVSSCQGHLSSNPMRRVSIIGELEDIRWIQKSIAKINLENAFSFPIRYFLLKTQKKFHLYDGQFLNPQIIDICFGDYQLSETEKKQKMFEEFLLNNKRMKITEELDIRLVEPYLDIDDHIDTFV